ncbi:hypothetical protein VTO42DRAFT_2145 [Malbranchea cinnamomea]
MPCLSPLFLSRNLKAPILHVPCDIVLVINIFGSMIAEAPIHTEAGKKEETSLPVLDLTKHAARTIIETLNKNDRVGVVIFSREARMVYDISPTNPENRTAALTKIERLRPDSLANLSHGINPDIGLTGLREACFRDCSF